MEWTNLPTNYTDAVWSGKKKYSQIDNEDGTVSFEDVTSYSQKQNSFFGANDANQMNEAINTVMDKILNETFSKVKTINGVGPNAAGDVLITDGTFPPGAIDTEARNQVAALDAKLKLTSIEYADYHLGFYLDENGDLCQKED